MGEHSLDRDNQRLPFADRFEPALRLNEQAAGKWPLIPFSEGPAVCPGRHLVLLLTNTLLASRSRYRNPADSSSDAQSGPAAAGYPELFRDPLWRAEWRVLGIIS